MSSTTTASAAASTTNLLDSTSGKGQESAGQSLPSFLSALAVGFIIFSVELLAFIIMRNRSLRIYTPKTYLVPPRERVKALGRGLFNWLVSAWSTSSSEFIGKCGLDAYFFLRFLRTLLKIFIPLGMVIMPILIPLNVVHGRGSDFAVGANSGQTNVTGLDQLGWGNVRPTNTHRYWAHLVLAVLVVVYVCFVFFDELRGYIRLRQAYLTSPQHRLRASASTVLVTAIPPKWCTVEALDGLYDVFPGGIRNIWINRNFDELNEKVKMRDKFALALESAETDLIKRAKQNHTKKLEEELKKSDKKLAKEEMKKQRKAADAEAEALASGPGISSGNPHQIRHNLHELLKNRSRSRSRSRSNSRGKEKNKPTLPVPVVGQGLDLVGHGFGKIGGTVLGGFKRAEKEVDNRLGATGGFMQDLENPPPPSRSQGGSDRHDSTASTVRPVISESQSPEARELEQTEREDRSHQASIDGAGDGADAGPYNGNIDPRVDATGAPSTGKKANDVHESDVPSESSKAGWMFWKRNQKARTFDVPSPKPHVKEEDEDPLNAAGAQANGDAKSGSTEHAEGPGKVSMDSIAMPKRGRGDHDKMSEYPEAFDEKLLDDNDGEPLWKKYVDPKDRDQMRLPIFGLSWMPSLPLIGRKVDTIYYCRREVARLNVEIEQDQSDPEKFPLMNSAFIQFNHQVAAHMACQAVSHHLPQHMAPRVVEISPDDVIWDNMSMRWWESYIRVGLIITLVGGLIIGWAFPVAFTGLLSNISNLTALIPWLDWLLKLPHVIIGIIQGVLPQALLAGLLALLPITLRFLAKQQGVQTGMLVELSAQNYYFAFLFVQVFLVVSISSGITSVIKEIVNSPQDTPQLLAQNLPKASDYFFSYMLLQAFSVSAGALVQVGSLISWYILAPCLDNTARQKWQRNTSLTQIQWGTFFPVYTNLACIGLIYCVISPLMILFNIITFGLFWIVYRYNSLYVTRFSFDTGGLLYPRAINQMFTGLYVMELCLIGLFLLVRDQHDKASCFPQAIIMIVVTFGTMIYQYLLNEAFGPLTRYLPITLEDEAVQKDEAFARLKDKQFRLGNEKEGDNLQDALEDRERRSEEIDREMEAYELKKIEEKKRNPKYDPRKIAGHYAGQLVPKQLVPKVSWADRSKNRRSKNFGLYPTSYDNDNSTHNHHLRYKDTKDAEAQGPNTIADALFAGINDDIEDLTPDERDRLIQRAFQHSALRAKRPVIWLPRDDLGVSDDEIVRTQRFTRHIWISNEFTGLDYKGRVVYKRSPPDFSEVDLIQL